METQRPQRGRGSSGTRDPSPVAVSVGDPVPAGRPAGRPAGAGHAQSRATAGGDPPVDRGKREAARATRSPKKIAGHPLRNAAERYAQIESMSGTYKLKWLCEALLVSRSGYYDWLRRRQAPGLRQRENARLRERIREEFTRSRQTYGSPRLAHQLGLA